MIIKALYLSATRSNTFLYYVDAETLTRDYVLQSRVEKIVPVKENDGYYYNIYLKY